MKRIFVIISFVYIYFSINAQENNQLNEFIVSSINSYIKWNNDFVKRGISLSDTSIYYVCMDGLPKNFCYEKLQNVTFFSFNNIDGLPSSFKKKLKKGIKTLFININISNNQLVITVAGKGVRNTKKNYIGIIIGDFGIYTYKYSCERRRWILFDTRYGGV